MHVSAQSGLGVVVTGFDEKDPHHVATVRDLIYTKKIVVLKAQECDAVQFRTLGEAFGDVIPYYEPLYHHPDAHEVFVSSNVPVNGHAVGVPRTGLFWHSDYQFMARPFDITMIFPKVIPQRNRGTYFINLATAYRHLPERLQDAAQRMTAVHTVRRYFKIRPDDVYRPLGDIVAEVEARTPPVQAPAVQRHGYTGEPVLYISEGFTVDLLDESGTSQPDLLHELLAASGQTEPVQEHPALHLQTYEAGDMLLWDNRCLSHRAVHAARPEPAVSWRVTVQDRTLPADSIQTPAMEVTAR